MIGVYSPIEKSPFQALTMVQLKPIFGQKKYLLSLGKLVTGQFTIDALSGPVGIYESTDTVAKHGIYYLMKWAGMLSINLEL